MASLVLGVGSSHSPMLNSAPEEFENHAEYDRNGRSLLDATGTKRSYDDLMALSRDLSDQLTDDVLLLRTRRCADNIDILREKIRSERLDALIVIGDDQREQFSEDNMPALLVYSGSSIPNKPLILPHTSPEWWRRARSQYHVTDEARNYPVASELAQHVIEVLVKSGFDVSTSSRLPKDTGEGHAFGFVHQRLMHDDSIVPIVPIALNTYFPPNQPTPSRCYDLGRGIRSAVEAFPRAHRIGIVASGGLSHFVIDEVLDRDVLNAMLNKDESTLRELDPRRLNSGTSEIRNWIAVASACERLSVEWHDYVPCYRSMAGTGCGMGFMQWS